MDMQREYWNDVAGPRWAAAQEQLDEVLLPYAEALREAATVPDGATLVDVGCGCGATTLMARECSPRARIVGLDVSEPMLAVARRRATEKGLDDVGFVLGDAAGYPVEPGSVRRIVSRFGVMFFGDPGAAFAHMGSWLESAGSMVVTVWGTLDENPWMSEVLERIGRHVELPRADLEAPGPFSLGRAARRREIAERAGLRLAEEVVLDQPVFVKGEVPELVAYYGERGPAAAALASATEEQRATVLEELRAFLAERHDGRGVGLPGRAYRLTLERR